MSAEREALAIAERLRPRGGEGVPAISRCRSRSRSASPRPDPARMPRRSCAPPTVRCSRPSGWAATAAWSTTPRRSQTLDAPRPKQTPPAASSSRHAMLLAETLDLRDVATARHSEKRPRALRRADRARARRSPPDHIVRVRVAGVLHDIGKLGISDAVLLSRLALQAARMDRDQAATRAGRADPRARQPARRGELGAPPTTSASTATGYPRALERRPRSRSRAGSSPSPTPTRR